MVRSKSDLVSGSRRDTPGTEANRHEPTSVRSQHHMPDIAAHGRRERRTRPNWPRRSSPLLLPRRYAFAAAPHIPRLRVTGQESAKRASRRGRLAEGKGELRQSASPFPHRASRRSHVLCVPKGSPLFRVVVDFRGSGVDSQVFPSRECAAATARAGYRNKSGSCRDGTALVRRRSAERRRPGGRGPGRRRAEAQALTRSSSWDETRGASEWPVTQNFPLLG